MASRQFDILGMTIPKRTVTLWAAVAVPSGTAPVLQKWNYGQFGGGSTSAARTYTAAPTTGGGTSYPTRYAQGADGIFSVTRTGVGLWTLSLQDNYQRVLNVSGSMAIDGGLANIVAVAENLSLQNMSAVGGSTIGVALLSATGAAADPTASASTLVRIQIELCDASEP